MSNIKVRGQSSWRIVYILLFVSSLVACEDRVRFEEPQPTEKNNLRKIPGRLRGTYLSTSDSTYLTIDEKKIVKWSNLEISGLRDSLDLEIDSARLEAVRPDSIWVSDGNYMLTIKQLPNDSLMVYYSYRDTVFQLSEEHVLRKFRGHYFLNYKIRNSQWRVRQLTLENGELSFSKITVPEDLEDLRKISEVEEIDPEKTGEIFYRLKPSKKEFKRLIKHRFYESRRYRKVATPDP